MNWKRIEFSQPPLRITLLLNLLGYSGPRCEACQIQMLPSSGINCLNVANPWSVKLVPHDIGLKGRKIFGLNAVVEGTERMRDWGRSRLIQAIYKVKKCGFFHNRIHDFPY